MKEFYYVCRTTNINTMKNIVIILGICLLTAISCRQAGDQKETTMKNEVIENIMARRSIRKYKAEPVDRETMAKILECGINAPSGMNRQSWEVRVVDNPELMNEMKEAMAAGHPDMDPQMVKGCFRGAPTMIFRCFRWLVWVLLSMLNLR